MNGKFGHGMNRCLWQEPTAAVELLPFGQGLATAHHFKIVAVRCLRVAWGQPSAGLMKDEQRARIVIWQQACCPPGDFRRIVAVMKPGFMLGEVWSDATDFLT